MAVHISDSVIFQSAWSTPKLRELFEDRALIEGWIEVMVILAKTEAEFNLIPQKAAEQLETTFNLPCLDDTLLAEAKEGFEHSNHSLFGLIKALQKRSPDDSGEWWCYGATVQDITDTQMARILMQVHQCFSIRLDHLIDSLCQLAHCYRDTPLCGRTHGQPGLPITLGFKMASWLDELLRHRQRLREIHERISVGQLAGGVGSLSSFGTQALDLQQRFLTRLGLGIPIVSWTACRDRLAEWLNLLTLIVSTSDRIGHEVYNLQRPEIGELSEGFVAGTVGSITMPQKRNPEISEHLGTLARTVRYHAAQMNESLVHDHERDGRAWKSEWVLLPPACLATDKALMLLQTLLDHLQVHSERMYQNIQATQGFIFAEQVMLALAEKIGRQSAHELLYRIAMKAQEQGHSLQLALQTDAQVSTMLSVTQINALFDLKHSTGCCSAMVDRVITEAESHLKHTEGSDE